MRLLLALTIVTALTACDQVDKIVERTLYKGTHIGLDKCVQRAQTTLVSGDVVRRACVQLHEHDVLAEINGRAGYEQTIGSAGKFVFKGSVVNDSSQYVVTAFSLELHHDDMDTAQWDSKTFRDLWIEPGRSFSILIDNDELSFQPKEDRIKEGDKFLYNWTVSKVRGITISVD